MLLIENDSIVHRKALAFDLPMYFATTHTADIRYILSECELPYILTNG